jgi:hypothetical protein
MRTLQTANKIVYTVVNVLVKGMLLLSIFAGMVYFNYSVGSAYVPPENRYDNEISLALLAGENLERYEQLNERQVLAYYVYNMQEAPDTIALGSSRILQMRSFVAGTESFYNCGMSGADFYDILGTFYLFDKADKLPKNMIIGLDPWLLNPNTDSSRSNMDLYGEFLSAKLGVETEYTEQEPLAGDYEGKLLSVEYFRENLKRAGEDQTSGEELPVVTGDIYNQATNLKLADGSVLYSRSFREQPLEAIEAAARVDAGSFLWMDDYTAPDAKRCEIFDQFIAYARTRGVNVIFMLSPYHPTVFSFVTENRDRYPGFFLTEPWFVNYAIEKDIPIYGSYNPYLAETWQGDFYDGLHIRETTLPRVFPGIGQVLAQQATGHPGSSYQLQTPHHITEEAALRIANLQTGVDATPNHSLAYTQDDVVDGKECYMFKRYASPLQSGAVLATYAVTKDEGFLYRLDTSRGQWVHDAQF